MTDGSLVDVWQFTVVIAVGAIVMGALERRVKEPQTALVIAVISGVAAAVFTPLPLLLAGLIGSVRSLFP